MAPVSSGDRVLVVSSPYKSHTHSWASIQLGQHKLKPFAADPWALSSCHKVGWWAKTPRPLLIPVLQPCSLRLTLRWMGSKISKHLNHPSTPVMRLRGICFGEQHARILWTISSHRPLSQHQTTLFVPLADARSDISVGKTTRVDIEGSRCKNAGGVRLRGALS